MADLPDAFTYNNLNDFINSDNYKLFPYKRLYYSNKAIKLMFKNLKKVDFSDRVVSEYYSIFNVSSTIKSTGLLYLNKPRLLISKTEDYLNFDLLSDMFQEENRMNCKFFSAVSSPYDYYEKHKRKLANGIIEKKQLITPHTLREELYDSVKECSSFKPSNLIYIIKLFNAKSVLDPSSGWSDRLLAAMATNVRYVGVDPNHVLHPVYQEIINFFMPKNSHKKYTMIEDTIQNATLPNEKFDLVFTSPPYFKIEQYSNKGMVTDSDEHAWFKNFMIPMINKTANKLKQGGHLVLVINQLPREKYIQKMIDYIYNSNLKLHFLGVIGYTNKKRINPQPMWIWEKSLKIPVALYNPPMVITKHVYNNIKFSVFRDDELIGGTKQRALVPLISGIKQSKIIFSGTPLGLGQVALAYIAKLTHKKAILFINKMPKLTNLTKYAISFNSSELHEINGTLKQVQSKAQEYNTNNKDSYSLGFGLDEPLFVKYLTSGLKQALPDIEPKRIWIVFGSGTILKVLYKIYPKTEFNVIEVGKKVWNDELELDRTTLYRSEERFVDIAKYLPPYPTVATYDAKLWVFFMKYGKSGDYIWNIGKDVQID